MPEKHQARKRKKEEEVPLRGSAGVDTGIISVPAMHADLLESLGAEDLGLYGV